MAGRTMAEAATEAGLLEADEAVETTVEETDEVSEPLETVTGEDSEEVSTTDEWPEEVPESYMGTPLKGVVPPEAAKDYYNVLKEQERVVNRRLAEIAEARKAEVEEAPPVRRAQQEEPEAPSVEDQLRELGADPDLIEQVGLMPLAAKLLELESTVTTANTASQAQEWERSFHSQLDALEQEHGKLPHDRESVVEYAIDQDVYSPAALYWSIAGPLKVSVAQEMKKRTKAAEAKATTAKKAVSGTRRAGTSSGSTSSPDKPKSIAEAFEMAKKNG